MLTKIYSHFFKREVSAIVHPALPYRYNKFLRFIAKIFERDFIVVNEGESLEACVITSKNNRIFLPLIKNGDVERLAENVRRTADGFFVSNGYGFSQWYLERKFNGNIYCGVMITKK